MSHCNDSNSFTKHQWRLKVCSYFKLYIIRENEVINNNRNISYYEIYYYV